MIKHRLEIVEGLHIAHFYDCPITLVEAAAQMAGPQATVENFRPIRPVAGVQGWAALQLQLAPDSEISLRNVRSLCLDISLSNAEFISLSPLWNQRGVYALFTERGPLAFRASNFDDARRYKALQNYGWTLEIAIPDGTSHWGRFVSPNKELINRLAEKAGLSKDEQKAAASGLFPKDYRAGKESLLKILQPWNRTEPPSAAEVELHRKELSTWLENAKSIGWTRKEVYD